MKNVLRSIAATATVLLAFTVAPAASAATHELGELVDYPLTAPVDGDHYFADWFWAARSHGIHHAQDLMSPKMTPVVAAADGVVRLVNWTDEDHMNPDRCCTIALRHNDGWESWYIHLNNDTPGTDDGLAWGIAPGIQPGVRVVAGQLIGWVGPAQENEKELFADDDYSRYLINEIAGKGGVERVCEVILRGRRGEVTYDKDGNLVRDEEVWKQLDEAMARMPKQVRGLKQAPLDMRTPPRIRALAVTTGICALCLVALLVSLLVSDPGERLLDSAFAALVASNRSQLQTALALASARGLLSLKQAAGIVEFDFSNLLNPAEQEHINESY